MAVTAEVSAAVPRDERLAVEATKLRSGSRVPVDRWFQIIGTALPLIGILGIVSAWYGVSHTAREWRQTPYVVSGGLLGLGLIFLGGFTYFAYWLTKLLEQSHLQTATLERIEAALTGRDIHDAADAGELVVAGGVAHRASCPVLAGQLDVRPLTPKDKARQCPVCEPDL